jgi:hypothetical protein
MAFLNHLENVMILRLSAIVFAGFVQVNVTHFFKTLTAFLFVLHISQHLIYQWHYLLLTALSEVSCQLCDSFTHEFVRLRVHDFFEDSLALLMVLGFELVASQFIIEPLNFSIIKVFEVFFSNNQLFLALDGLFHLVSMVAIECFGA